MNSQPSQTLVTEVKAVIYFEKRLHHVLQGSKYASDDDCCWTLRERVSTKTVPEWNKMSSYLKN